MDAGDLEPPRRTRQLLVCLPDEEALICEDLTKQGVRASGSKLMKERQSPQPGLPVSATRLLSMPHAGRAPSQGRFTCCRQEDTWGQGVLLALLLK